MLTQIIGQVDDPNNNDPVEVRALQVLDAGLEPQIGLPASPVYYDLDGEQPAHYWQYFDTGVIVWSENTCAQVLYGPIMDYWGTTGQFQGPLGSPATDITPAPQNDGEFYAVFEHGVLWQYVNGDVTQSNPVQSSDVEAFTGFDPTISGITQLAQQTLSSLAQSALATNQQLMQYVSSINSTVTFDSIGLGGCSGASFSSAGTSLLPSHIFKVHFDFGLNGCAGAFGDATADIHVTVRLTLSATDVQAFLVSYTIDAVGSPFEAANQQIKNGLTNALNDQFGSALVDASIP